MSAVLIVLMDEEPLFGRSMATFLPRRGCEQAIPRAGPGSAGEAMDARGGIDPESASTRRRCPARAGAWVSGGPAIGTAEVRG